MRGLVWIQILDAGGKPLAEAPIDAEACRTMSEVLRKAAEALDTGKAASLPVPLSGRVMEEGGE